MAFIENNSVELFNLVQDGDKQSADVKWVMDLLLA